MTSIGPAPAEPSTTSPVTQSTTDIPVGESYKDDNGTIVKNDGPGIVKIKAKQRNDKWNITGIEVPANGKASVWNLKDIPVTVASGGKLDVCSGTGGKITFQGSGSANTWGKDATFDGRAQGTQTCHQGVGVSGNTFTGIETTEGPP